MHTFRPVVALLALAGPALLAPVALAADSATPAAAPPAQAAQEGQKISKSRSNIQNNRTAPADEGTSPADGAETTEVLKTKTKSNQSND